MDQNPRSPSPPKVIAQGNRNATSRSKNDEEDRHEIEADVERHAGVVERIEAAFVSRQLLGIGF